MSIIQYFQSYFSLIKSNTKIERRLRKLLSFNPILVWLNRIPQRTQGTQSNIFQSYFSLIKSPEQSSYGRWNRSSFNPILVWLNPDYTPGEIAGAVAFQSYFSLIKSQIFLKC